jgi:hypothetical protein
MVHQRASLNRQPKKQTINSGLSIFDKAGASLNKSNLK